MFFRILRLTNIETVDTI